MSLAAGTRLGPYEILSPLGVGGMGEVYRARDSRLNRDVALKVLPEAFTIDAGRLARFKREAQVLASLNHPHIAQIYGVEDSGAVPALVLELVDGDTVADRLARGPFPMGEALPIARQIAAALEAAHEHGIVHRDLKPANIKVRDDGTVKLLDFGLAKASVDLASSPAAATMSAETSLEGLIVGTVSYMSPEQARGRPIDKRTDIWAFGCVLFEMLTGGPAFPGDTLSDVLAGILERQPDWSALPGAMPTSIERLLRRCLEKDARQRLHDIADARLELEDPGPARHGEATAVTVPAASRPARWLWQTVAILAIAAAAAGWYVRTRDRAIDNPLTTARFTRLTDFEGIERDGAISPDGKFVAFVSDRDGPFDIWLGQAGSGEFVNLTQGREPNLDVSIRAIGFALDGSELWFKDAAPTTPMRLLPLVGGAPRVFLSKGPIASPPAEAAWSSDGTRMVYHTSDPGDPMFVADAAGSNPRALYRAGSAVHNHWPAWSPDGRWIYFSSGNPVTQEFDLWRIAASGGQPERLTHHNTLVAYATPLGPRTVMYVAREQDGSGPWLWTLDPERKVSHRVSFGLEQYTSLSASADGRRLAATVANPTANLWSMPIADHAVSEAEVTRVEVPTVRALGPRFGGSALFYLSSHGAGDGLWRYDRAQAVEIWQGADGALLAPAAASRSGRQVAFALRKEGHLRLHVLNADGGDLRALAPSIDVQGTAGWSPDGEWVVVGGLDGQGPGLFKIPIGGGTPVRVVNGPAVDPAWSPDGRLIVYAGPNVGPEAPLLAVKPDGQRVELPAIKIRRDGIRARFLPDGRGLVYMQGFSASQDFWLLDLASGKSRQLSHLSGRGAMRTFDISPEGTRIVFDRIRENSDIVLIDLSK